MDPATEYIIPKTLEEFDKKSDAEELFDNAFKDPKMWSRVPILNYSIVESLPNLSIARFRGMIQDMENPEYYLEHISIQNDANEGSTTLNGKYREIAFMDYEEAFANAIETHFETRRPYYVVSVPGMNEWAQSYEADANAAVIDQMKDNAVDDPTKLELNCNSTTSSENISKSNIQNAHVDGIIVKTYDNEDYHLNTLVDIVGFLSKRPVVVRTGSVADDNGEQLDCPDSEKYYTHVLHAIVVRKLTNSNPLLDEHISFCDKNINMAAVESDFLKLLEMCLYNDSLAANYLLSHLISNTVFNSDKISIGSFSLNISNLPNGTKKDEYIKKLYDILSLLVPASSYMPLTLENLNNKSYIPKQNLDTSKLIYGPLQLSSHTQLVIDETCLEEGELNETGVKNIHNIKEFIEFQHMNADFIYYITKYNINNPVLVMSEGKSLLPCKVHVPLECDAKIVEHIDSVFKAAYHFLTPARLNLFRRYITLAQERKAHIHLEVKSIIEDDFVEMRKAQIMQSGDDLHLYLTKSSLLAIRSGKNIIDTEIWNAVKKLETERFDRKKKLNII